MNTSNTLAAIEQRMVAYHEAGHLVAAYALGRAEYAMIWPREKPSPDYRAWAGQCRFRCGPREQSHGAIISIAAPLAALRSLHEWDAIDPMDVVDYHDPRYGPDAGYDDDVAVSLNVAGMSPTDLDRWEPLSRTEQIRAANAAAKILQLHDAELTRAVNLLLVNGVASSFELATVAQETPNATACGGGV